MSLNRSRGNFRMAESRRSKTASVFFAISAVVGGSAAAVARVHPIAAMNVTSRTIARKEGPTENRSPAQTGAETAISGNEHWRCIDLLLGPMGPPPSAHIQA